MYIPQFVVVILAFLVFAFLMAVARLLTIWSGTVSGRIPKWVSFIYILSFVGMVAVFLWSIWRVGWWSPFPLLAVYFVAGYVSNVANKLITPLAVVAKAQQTEIESGRKLSDEP